MSDFTKGLISIIIPAYEAFLSITSKTVAVPKSQITIGGLYFSSAATEVATVSAPSCAGLSIFILSPDFIPGPTTTGAEPDILTAAVLILSVSSGTTEHITAPLIFFDDTP